MRQLVPINEVSQLMRQLVPINEVSQLMRQLVPINEVSQLMRCPDCNACRTNLIIIVQGVFISGSPLSGASCIVVFSYAFSLADLINPTNLVHLCKELQDLTIENIKFLHNKFQSKESVKEDFPDTKDLGQPEVLFRVLYQWHIGNPQATMKHLAKLMKDSGLHSQAIKLDPSCE